MPTDVKPRLKIVVLAGIGGVGKTSLSAALGFCGAMHGLNTVTFTIDPARRLADTLGIQMADDTLQSISLKQFMPPESGIFRASMLNLETIAESLVRRYASSEIEADRILSNPLFKKTSRQIAGSEEFLALGKLYQLITDETMDLLIVDTAPAQHSLDFFSGPEKLMRILEPSVMDKIKSPVKRFINTKKIQGSGPGAIIGRIATKLAGQETVNSFFSLCEAMAGMYDSFCARVNHLNELLSDPDVTSVVLVSTPCNAAISETGLIADSMISNKIPLKSIVFNRVSSPLTIGRQLQNQKDGPNQSTPSDSFQIELSKFVENYLEIVRKETVTMNQFMSELPRGIDGYRVPLLSGEVISLNDIFSLNPYLEGIIRS